MMEMLLPLEPSKLHSCTFELLSLIFNARVLYKAIFFKKPFVDTKLLLRIL